MQPLLGPGHAPVHARQHPWPGALYDGEPPYPRLRPLLTNAIEAGLALVMDRRLREEAHPSG